MISESVTFITCGMEDPSGGGGGGCNDGMEGISKVEEVRTVIGYDVKIMATSMEIVQEWGNACKWREK